MVASLLFHAHARVRACVDWFDSDFWQIYHPLGMGQPARTALLERLWFAVSFVSITTVVAAAFAPSCARESDSTAPPTSQTSAAAAPAAATSQAARAKPTVASLVPAATDLIVSMGCADHLVAVSNYDEDRPGTHGLPRVGDYLNNDWEKLASVRPDVMITQYDTARTPPGLKERADQLGIRLVNSPVERVGDIFDRLTLLGDVLGEPEKAKAAATALRLKLDAVAQRVSGRPRVRTLIVLDDDGTFVAGANTFLDDVLQIAGGENVIANNANRYPRIDREMLMTLKPDAIVQLLPKATPQVKQQAAKTWASLQQIPAVRDRRVYVFDQWYVVQPGFELGDLAEQIAAALHPDTAETQATTQATNR
jgi:iron complex transport system substrate-binding protein